MERVDEQKKAQPQARVIARVIVRADTDEWRGDLKARVCLCYLYAL